MFHSEAILWLAAIPFVAGLGFLAYGGFAPMAHADGWQLPRLAKPRIYGSLGVACISVTILMGGTLEYWGTTVSPKPTLVGKVTYLNRLRAKNGWDAQFTLAADDGSFVDIRTNRLMKGLKNGDQVRATVITFNGDLLYLEVLTGDSTVRRLDCRGLARRSLDLFLLFGCIYGLGAAGIATGKLKSWRQRRDERLSIAT
jgi:hypothetical protein